MSEEVKTFIDFMAFAARTFTPNRNIRYGQHWFNVLHLFRPDIANELQKTHFNPFYQNYLPPQCVPFVGRRWNETQKEAQ